ncbi:MAG: hydratase, partial [Acetivibrio sp.]
ELVFGPGIVDWPPMVELTNDILLRVVSVIHDPVTTTDELIPSGETSSYRSNPLGLAEFTLSRKDPEYVGRAKAVRTVEEIRRNNVSSMKKEELFKKVFDTIKETYPELQPENTEIGSVIYAVKPGDGSAREQAASCQRVLSGLANIASEYATKRYRSNLINWGMLPFILDGKEPFENGDFIFIKDIKKAVKEKSSEIKAYVVKENLEEFTLKLGELTEDERTIIQKGCLINYYKG